MPGLDGFEVCQRLKDDAESRTIPVMLMTALSQVEDRIKGLEAGADDFLTKPVRRDELLARIRTSLRLRPASDVGSIGPRQNDAYPPPTDQERA